MDHRELMAPIVEAPDDDAPRLVYADWLMQQDDPRGELIALQCALARADAADELVSDEPAIVARERDLRTTHGETWLAPLRARLTAGFEFRRGFVEHVVAFRGDDLARAGTALFEAAPLVRSLAVPSAFLADIPAETLARLETLSLLEPEDDRAYNEAYTIADAASAVAPHLTRLRRFEVVNARLAPETVRTLLAVPGTLDHLRLDLNRQYSDARVEADHILATLATASPFATLRSLELEGIHTGDLSPLVALSGLTHLALRHCEIPGRAVLDLVTRLPRLRSLDLDLGLDRDLDADLDVAAPGELELEALAALPALRHLRVRGGGADDNRVIALAASPHAARLRRLDLRANPIGHLGARALASLPLYRLDLDVEPAPVPRATYRPAAPSFTADLERLMATNLKIAAIKQYRELSGASLAASKLAVERMIECMLDARA